MFSTALCIAPSTGMIYDYSSQNWAHEDQCEMSTSSQNADARVSLGLSVSRVDKISTRSLSRTFSTAIYHATMARCSAPYGADKKRKSKKKNSRTEGRSYK